MVSGSAGKGSRKHSQQIVRVDVSNAAAPRLRRQSQAEADANFVRALGVLRRRGEVRGARRAGHLRDDQTAWLVRQRNEMETRLEQLGLPRDCWREISIMCITGPGEPEPFREVNIAWPQRQPAPLRDFVRAEVERARKDALVVHEALWIGAIAWAADYALATRDPEVRLRVGRYMEAFRVFLRLPEWGKKAVRHARAQSARDSQAEKAKERKPLLDMIADEYRRLRANGHTQNSAAELICNKDGSIRKGIQREAAKLGLTPWRGEFYSLSGIRKIARRAETNLSLNT